MNMNLTTTLFKINLYVKHFSALLLFIRFTLDCYKLYAFSLLILITIHGI